MDHRYNYFQRNSNPLVNGQASFSRSSTDGTQSTNNYSGSISSISSQEQSPFYETKHTIPNAVPLTNNFYQMDSTNQLPRSSGPPRTNAKGTYENPQSSIPNVMNLAQSNAENYPFDPDFQLQPHLTGLLPQQSKKVPEQLYSVDKYSSNRGSITANMNTNYFSSSKSYPEPKIIEYDVEDTSTESSPQHTSSLYSESTDQDSESIHPNNDFRHNLNKNIDCHVTKESKTIMSSNQELPVPSQFADLSLARDDEVDDQHSILHNAYNQDDDDNVIEDIPLVDNINQNEIDYQENLKSQFSEKNINTSKSHAFDNYSSNNDVGQSQFRNENKQNPPIFNNINSSNFQNAHQSNKESYFHQSNILTQPSSSNNPGIQPQSKPLFPYGNTELYSHQQEQSNIQNYNDGSHLGSYNQQNKHIQPIFQNSNVSQIDSKFNFNAANSFTQDKKVPIQSMSPAQTLNDENSSQSMQSSSSTILCNQPNVQTIASNSQHFITNSSSSTSIKSVSPITSAFTNAATLKSLSSVSESIVSENQITPYHNNYGQDSKDIVQSELNVQLSESNNGLVNSQQENSVNQLEPAKVQPIENKSESLPPAPIRNFMQPNNSLNSQNTTSQQGSNYQQPLTNQFTPQQFSYNDHLKTSSDQFLNKQNTPVQESIQTSKNVSHYFDSTSANNQSIFNPQSFNLQPRNQLQNVEHTQDIKPIISSLPPSDKPNNFMTFSNMQNTPVSSISSNKLQPPLIKNKLETSSNMSSKETTALNSSALLHSSKSALIQSDNLNTESLENTETMTFNSQVPDNIVPNDQFSNMTIDNQQNTRIKQEQAISASYFSKESSLDKENSSNAFQNIFSTAHSIDSPSNKLSEANFFPQSVSSEQTNISSSNLNTSNTHQTLPLLINNQILPNEKQTSKPTANQFPPQQFSSKITSDVLPETNQLPSQVDSNDPKSDAFPSSASNQYPIPFNSQPTSNVNTPVSSESNQLPSQMFRNQSKSEMVPPYQSISNLYQTSASNQPPPQIFNSQPPSSTILPSSLASNQLPSNLVGHSQKSVTTPPFSTEVNQQSLKLSNSQSICSATPNPSTPNLVSNEPKLVSNEMNQEPSKLNNQSIPNTVQPVLSAVDALPSQMFNSSVKQKMIPPFQPAVSGYPAQSFNNESVTQNANLPSSSVSNSIPPHTIGNQPKSGFTSPLQSTTSQPISNPLTSNMVTPVSFTASQSPPQMFGYQSTLDPIPPPTISSQYSSQPYNQPRSNIPPSDSSNVNQLPPQMFNNQVKSDAVHSLQSTANLFPSQSMNNQLPTNTVPPVSLAVNQLSPQVFSNNPKTDVSSLPSTPNQYQSQPFNNAFRPNMIPPVASTANLFPPQMLSNQPRLNADPSNKLTASHYPSQLLNKNNQPLSNIQPATTQFPPSQFSNQSKPNIVPPPLNANQYPSQPFGNQTVGQPVFSKPNLQTSSSNQIYSQTNLASQPANNQWPPRPSVNQLNQPNQTSSMFTQPPTMNSSNIPNIPPNVNQPTQMLGSQMLPPNPVSSNNYYNQVQGIGNVHQPQPPILPGQNVQLTSKCFPQQSNMSFPTQTSYQQQPNAIHAQQGFQQQDPYKTEHNPSVVQQGFTKTWGHDSLDLLKSRDVLPGDGVQPPEIKLPQGYTNCDNCSSDIFRCTMNKFPSSKNLLEKSRLPLGILIHPYKDLSRLTVIQCETITRCRNCRSYINPFVQFIDNAHWKCNLCYRVNELPGEFQIDPYTKTLGDPSRRPEIQNATIEYIASQDYMVRPPQPALYLFLLDVSRLATLTGYLEIVCDRILNKIMSDDIPGDSRTNIGFITYDSCVHFYRIANCDGGQPKQLIISDISDIFLPLPDGLMVNLEENKAAIKDLLTNLPNHFRESYNTGCALGAALQAAFKLLAPRGGRVTVFQSSLPNCGPGSLQPRDDGSPHTGERVQHMTPSTDFYKKLALECSAEQIAVDMFFISSQYLDIATISGISKYSAGCIHNFSQFDVKSPTMVTRFINCFDRYLSRKIGFEALLRLRCTRGVSIHSFHGNFFVRSYDLLMLPNVNPDNAYGMQLSIEDNLEGVSVVCFQAALLYTSSNAERRIRVHTLCIPVTDNLNDVFHNADQQAISCLIAKMAVDRSTEKSLSDAREAFFNAISDSLSAFKLGCSSYNGPGTMLSPLSLKVFPLYILATLKHTAFRTNQPTRLDERMFSMCQMKSLPLNILIQYLYPDLYPIHNLEEQPKIDYEKLTEIPLPPVLQLSAERVESNGIYLMDDSETLTIFIGHRCSDQLIQKLFGYVNVTSMPELITTLPEVDSKPSYLLRSFISYVQHFKPYSLPIEIIKDNGPHKLRFYSRLVEDKFESSLSYYEFLQRLSQQVR